MDARLKSIIAHITPIGWIIAMLLNSNDKDEMTSFYLRQTLGLYIFSFVTWIPFIGWIIGLLLFAFWLLSLIYALQGEQKAVPYGEYFQQWFSSL
jgi:hypothetical protein